MVLESLLGGVTESVPGGCSYGIVVVQVDGMEGESIWDGVANDDGCCEGDGWVFGD